MARFHCVIQVLTKPFDKDESSIIPPNMFEVKKPFLLLGIRYYKQKENALK